MAVMRLGLHSHFHVQPNYNVEVVLRCVVVGVVTIAKKSVRSNYIKVFLYPLKRMYFY